MTDSMHMCEFLVSDNKVFCIYISIRLDERFSKVFNKLLQDGEGLLA